MYCKKCGKYFDGEGEYCADCQAKVASEQPTPAANSGNPKMVGFKKGLVSVILGYIGFLFANVAFGICMGLIDAGILSGDEIMVITGAVTLIIFCIVAIGLGIPAVLMGVQAVKIFKERNAAGAPKPIATLITGIAGLVFGALSLLLGVIYFVIAVLAL